MTQPEKLNFSVQGAGKAVLLVHGLASSLHEWDLLSPVLCEAGWRTVACDLLDHGDSPKEQEQECCHLPAVYASLVQWIEGLGLDAPFVLVGHSLGGYLGLQFALQCPERLRGLVLIDPVFSPEQIPGALVRAPQMLDFGQRMLHAAPKRVMESVMNLTFEPNSPMSAASRRQKSHDLLRAAKQVTRLVRGVKDLTPRLGEIRLPVWVAWGTRDRLLSPKSFPKLVSSLPNARGYPLEGCGHHPHLEKPAQVNGMIREFLKDCR